LDHDFNTKKLLNSEEEHDIFIKLHNSIGIEYYKIKDYIAVCNDGLVRVIVKKYARRDNYQDLLQEGRIGLLLAIDRFDPNRIIKFSTYAGWYIKMMIKKYYTDLQDMIRKSVHIHRIKNRENLTINQEKLVRKGRIKRELLENIDIGINDEILNDYVINFDYLDTREKYIITHRFGLFGNKNKTLKEIGSDLKISREYVRRIEINALIKLRIDNKNPFL
jgi:RNA polymerase sigma factor (sigma-70 family)